jgi:hypothetical protein
MVDKSVNVGLSNYNKNWEVQEEVE